VGPRGGARGLGWWREQAEVCAHRDGGNGGSAECVRAWGRNRGCFYRRARPWGCELRLKGREGDLRGRAGAEGLHTSSAGGTAGVPARGLAVCHAWRDASPGGFAREARGW
jgi:hypothetical protein